jgi:hypothetical protein
MDPWWSIEQVIGWLRSASPGLVRRIGAAPENRDRLIGIDIEAAIAKVTGVQVHHDTQEAATAYLRSKIAKGELDLHEEDASRGKLVKISSGDAAAFEIDKGTLKGRLPGGLWSDRFRLRTDQILRLRPELNAAEEVATSPDSILVPSNEVIPANPATAAKVAPNPTSVSVSPTESDPRGEAESLSAPTIAPVPQVTAAPEAEPMLHETSDPRVRDALRVAYAEAAHRGEKPPNVVEVRHKVQAILARNLRKATGRRIERIAGETEFTSLRWKPGQTKRSKRSTSAG